MIDTHAHLDDEQFDDDRDVVVARAADAGVEAIVSVGTTAASSQRTIELAGRYGIVHAAVGVQPNYVAEAKTDDWDQIVESASATGVVAIGETGLDRYWDHAPLELQQDYFDRHMRLAAQRHLPFIVHMRDCGEEILAMLLDEYRRSGPLSGVMHSYTGNAPLAAECVRLGMHISFAGMVTFKKSAELRSVAAEIPGERILIETDSPYLSPHPLRGKRNEPARVVHTAECLANVRGESTAEFVRRTSENAGRLFRLP